MLKVQWALRAYLINEQRPNTHSETAALLMRYVHGFLTYIIPFHEFVASCQAVGHRSGFELECVNSGLRSCHLCAFPQLHTQVMMKITDSLVEVQRRIRARSCDLNADMWPHMWTRCKRHKQRTWLKSSYIAQSQSAGSSAPPCATWTETLISKTEIHL